MIDYFKKRKGEREILHECLETLVQEYEYIESDELTDSICKIYECLNRGRSSSKFFCFVLLTSMIFNFFVGITVLIVNFFGC